MKVKHEWPKTFIFWNINGIGFVSIPFTWELPAVRKEIMKIGGRWFVGGPATDLMPDYFDDIRSVIRTGSYSGSILNMINPYATRTTIGCNRKCSYCGIGSGKIEKGGFRQLDR